MSTEDSDARQEVKSVSRKTGGKCEGNSEEGDGVTRGERARRQGQEGCERSPSSPVGLHAGVRERRSWQHKWEKWESGVRGIQVQIHDSLVTQMSHLNLSKI